MEETRERIAMEQQRRLEEKKEKTLNLQLERARQRIEGERKLAEVKKQEPLFKVKEANFAAQQEAERLQKLQMIKE